MRRPLARHLSGAAVGLLLIAVPLLVPVPGVAQDVQVTSPFIQQATLAPGETTTGSIEVENVTRESQRVRIYQRDYHFSHDGRRRYDEPGTRPRSNAEWTSVTPNVLVLEPEQTATVSYTVSVPSAPAVDSLSPPLRGTYWSAILVEPVPSDDEAVASISEDEAQVGIRQTFRFAVQVVTHIGETGKPKVDIPEASLVEATRGPRHLHVALKNTGTRGIRPDVRLEVYDEEGALAGEFEGESYIMYPSTSVRQRFPVGELGEGPYTALLVVDAGDGHVFGTQITLEL